ncbi:MAG: HAMP domain-containing sensor histidine kinase [Bacteroidota bacterium]|nr:HAMP domain-containing sensor histidine kinase [Bacteroidota bacterium]
MNKLNLILNNIFRQGVNQDQSSLQNFKISMTNRLSLFCFLFTVIYHIYLLANQFYIPSIVILCFGSVYLIIIYLNRLKLFHISRLIHTLISNIAIIVFSSFLTPDAGLYLFILLSPLFVYAFYGDDNKIISYSHIVIYVFTFLLVMWVNPIPSLDLHMSKDMVRTYYYMNVFMTLVMTCFLLDFIIKRYSQVNNQLTNLNESLKESEHNTKLLYENLKESHKNVEQFNYIVSHNLRAPIANLLGLAGIFDKKNINQKKNLEIIEHIEFAASNLDEIMKDLNEILSVKKTGLVEKYELIKLDNKLQEVFMTLANQIKISNAQINYDFSAFKEVFGLKSFVYSIFYNLISNAIKFSKENVQPIININVKPYKNGLMLTFSDNGIGINMKEKKDKLFKLFSRLNNNVDGKGMGLFLIKSQVEIMGGSVDIESKLGEGTTFKIYIPQ